MSVFLAEAPEALKMITGTATTIANSLHRLKHKDFVGAARVLVQGTPREGHKIPKVPATKSLSSRWLELQYGWLPLLSDAKSGAEQLADVLNVPRRQRYSAKVREERVTKTVHEWGASGTPCGSMIFQAQSQATRIHERTLRAYISEGPTVPQMLGLLNPELVAWELLPYSFVADWFIPIGDWLEARALASHLVGTFVTTDFITGTNEVPVALNGGFTLSPGEGSPTPWVRIQLDRTVSNVLDVPMPTFKPLTEAASWRHCANAVALLRQKFGSR